MVPRINPRSAQHPTSTIGMEAPKQRRRHPTGDGIRVWRWSEVASWLPTRWGSTTAATHCPSTLAPPRASMACCTPAATTTPTPGARPPCGRPKRRAAGDHRLRAEHGPLPRCLRARIAAGCGRWRSTSTATWAPATPPVQAPADANEKPAAGELRSSTAGTSSSGSTTRRPHRWTAAWKLDRARRGACTGPLAAVPRGKRRTGDRENLNKRDGCEDSNACLREPCRRISEPCRRSSRSS